MWGQGLDVVAKLLVKVTPITESVHLTPEVIAQLPAASAEQSLLEYEAPSKTFGFRYDRQWFVTSDEPNVAILRMIQRGELVAQCNISALLAVQKEITLAGLSAGDPQLAEQEFWPVRQSVRKRPPPRGIGSSGLWPRGTFPACRSSGFTTWSKVPMAGSRHRWHLRSSRVWPNVLASADREFLARLRFMTPPAKEAKNADPAPRIGASGGRHFLACRRAGAGAVGSSMRLPCHSGATFLAFHSSQSRFNSSDDLGLGCGQIVLFADVARQIVQLPAAVFPRLESRANRPASIGRCGPPFAGRIAK